MSTPTDTQPRFLPIEGDARFPDDGQTCWFWDTARPESGGQPFIAVQVYSGQDPNQYVRHSGMMLLFNDPAEYYAVCQSCYYTFRGMQWAGSTRGVRNWREQAEKYRQEHETERGWCEFCDPVFGNGGWLP